MDAGRAAIFAAHQELLGDPDLLRDSEARLTAEIATVSQRLVAELDAERAKSVLVAALEGNLALARLCVEELEDRAERARE